jgi:hypothetical protein
MKFKPDDHIELNRSLSRSPHKTSPNERFTAAHPIKRVEFHSVPIFTIVRVILELSISLNLFIGRLECCAHA